MIKNIELINLKKHTNLKLLFNQKISLLYGKNGAGKTSILEAISLFTIGKGIFNLDNKKLININSKFFKINLTSEFESYQIQCEENKKIVLINNNLSKPSLLSELISIFGISPYIALSFWNDITLRRKIFNRIILQYDQTYANHYIHYTKALKQRKQLLENNIFNRNWQEILDPIIKKHGKKINEIRNKVLRALIITNDLQEFIQDNLLINFEPNFEKQMNIFENILEPDFVGPHNTNFYLNTENTLQTSSGQQKKILIAFLILTASQNKNKENILLLDDALTILDQNTTSNLIQLLNKQNFQTIITNINAFESNLVQNILIE